MNAVPLFISICLAVQAMGFPTLDACLIDRECGVGSYCYQQRFCTSCEDCRKYNRLPGYKTCARNYNECGMCIEGYAQTDHTYGGAGGSKYCDLIDVNETSSASPTPVLEMVAIESTHGLWYITIFGGCCVGIIIFIGGLLIYRHKTEVTASQRMNLEISDPPSKKSGAIPHDNMEVKYLLDPPPILDPSLPAYHFSPSAPPMVTSKRIEDAHERAGPFAQETPRFNVNGMSSEERTPVTAGFGSMAPNQPAPLPSSTTNIDREDDDTRESFATLGDNSQPAQNLHEPQQFSFNSAPAAVSAISTVNFQINPRFQLFNVFPNSASNPDSSSHPDNSFPSTEYHRLPANDS